MSYFDENRIFQLGNTTSRIDYAVKLVLNFRVKRRNRMTVLSLLKKQDSLLRDMGIDREDIRTALSMKGDASENLKYLIRERNGDP